MSSFKRSASVRLRGQKANLSSSLPISEADGFGDFNSSSPWNKNYGPLSLNRSRVSSSNRLGIDDDLESIGSVASNFSVVTTNSTCEHANFAKNGTTYSGRSHKYIVHCSSSWKDHEEYLTPTQRANRSIKKLKSLLQLAKEKLREKEEELFKLNKEVVELKTFKANVDGTAPCKVLQESPKGIPSTSEGSRNHLISSKEYCQVSPIKFISDEQKNKISPSPSQDGIGDKNCRTPDILFTSLADSGNYDDLPSSASIHSKDSLNFLVASDVQIHDLTEQNDSAIAEEVEEIDIEAVVKAYEKKLEDKRLEYEVELRKLINMHEERNIRMISEFDARLKEEELKFEALWNDLLKTTENEKIAIVNRFEEKLEEERQKYRESLSEFKAKETKHTSGIDFEEIYCKNVDEEKTIYETALMDIKQKFETDKQMIEKKFDDTMMAERDKFESNLRTIQQLCDCQVAKLTKKVADLEVEYSQLLPKYEKVVSETEELEKENESLKATIKQQEENHRKMFLTIYKKGQEAARIEMEAQQEVDESDNISKKISVPELFAQLKITEVELENLKDKEYRAAHSDNDGLCLLSSKEAISLWLLAARKAMYKRLAEAQTKSSRKDAATNDPEATLQFLKSAVYYFLTDRENHVGHLKAIESILAFSSTEKSNIEKLYLNRY
ncbi:hypothetical protein RUM44_009050 [Polyplax serrata]|uniref:GRIP domain-containing protein n=1 Tax=Polyplax serrata TaxID=468196 RepID=A0ABR1ARM8_POLSC